jgi:hypothetical protein
LLVKECVTILYANFVLLVGVLALVRGLGLGLGLGQWSVFLLCLACLSIELCNGSELMSDDKVVAEALLRASTRSSNDA